jgi:hypothetical protein
MKALEKALYEILEADHPQTVRQVYYQMVSRGLIDKTEQEYDGNVVRLLGEMRENAQVPWDWVIDNSRWVRKPVTYDGLTHAIYSLAGPRSFTGRRAQSSWTRYRRTNYASWSATASCNTLTRTYTPP